MKKIFISIFMMMSLCSGLTEAGERSLFMPQGEDGKTALHSASENGRVDVVNCLLKVGARIDIQNNDDNTALDLARENGYQEIVELLVAAEARANATQ